MLGPCWSPAAVTALTKHDENSAVFSALISRSVLSTFSQSLISASFSYHSLSLSLCLCSVSAGSLLSSLVAVGSGQKASLTICMTKQLCKFPYRHASWCNMLASCADFRSRCWLEKILKINAIKKYIYCALCDQYVTSVLSKFPATGAFQDCIFFYYY